MILNAKQSQLWGFSKIKLPRNQLILSGARGLAVRGGVLDPGLLSELGSELSRGCEQLNGQQIRDLWTCGLSMRRKKKLFSI